MSSDSSVSQKRKRRDGADGNPRRNRRQPQTSCDLCRSKKLKCDRAQPCSNCVSRGLACTGQLGAASSISPIVSNNDIITRLQKLEEAVFRSSRELNTPQSSQGHSDDWSQTHSSSRVHSTCPFSRVTSTPDSTNEGDDTSELDYGYTGEFISEHIEKLDIRVARVDSTRAEPSHVQAVNCSTYILLPSEQDALALLRDYVENSSYFLRIIYEPFVRKMIKDTYHQLAHDKSVSRGAVALILSICATSAFSWDKTMSLLYDFRSEEEGQRASEVWRDAAWQILDQSQRVPSDPRGVIQSEILLADLVYNIEGCSPRFRYLQSRAIVAARELCLHAVDSPAQAARDTDGPAAREMKRRIWWHLAATDWLLAIAGGSCDHTYLVNPRHMQVRLPRNFNDSDLGTCDETTIPSLERATDISFILQRIRLAEVCRVVADTLGLNAKTVADLPTDQVLYLDQLFEDAMNDFPLSVRLDADHPDSEPLHIRVQRRVIYLAFLARRAKLLRPFLDMKLAGSNQYHSRFRTKCLDSSLAVIDIASHVLEKSLAPKTDQNGALRVPGCPLTHRSGTVLSALFMACAVLATDPFISDGSDCIDKGAAERRTKLAQACRLLERCEESPMASKLVRRLVGVLNRHSVGRLEERHHPALPQATQGDAQGYSFLSSGQLPAIAADPLSAGIQEPAASLDHGGNDALEVNDLWNSFMSSMPADDWSTLFADLDTFYNPF